MFPPYALLSFALNAQMQNIDEICDSVHASERITFASISTAFDEETTIEDSCTFDQGK